MSKPHHTNLVGVFGSKDPNAALKSLRLNPAWQGDSVAFADSPVWMDRSGVIVVSGEVLLDNGLELRRTLSLPDAQDGEILAELFFRLGARAGLEARGMYAVVIWDTRNRTLHLLRDSVGCRTLYYGKANGVSWFATRLRALERTPLIGEISTDALRDYLTYSFVPGSQTMWRDVQEVRPGTMVSLPDGTCETYWEPREQDWDDAASLEQHASRLRDTLVDAVTSALPASGPVGVFLSGGVDSSLVTAIAAQYARGPVHTYSIHFGRNYAHELEFSEMVARHCGTQHHVIEITPQLVVDNLAETMAVLDDPIGDPLTVPNLLLGERASLDVDVILNGEGGDPCFGGPKNHAMFLHQMYAADERCEQAYLRSYRKCYIELDRLLQPELASTDETRQKQASLLSPYFDGTQMKSYLNRLMHINVRLKGADHILTKVNNLTRRNGILGQSPLFDRRVVDASFTTPPWMKLSGTDEKVVLKRAIADLLPDAILARPKSGMMVPVNGWARKELKGYVEAIFRGAEEARSKGPVTRLMSRGIFRRFGGSSFGNKARLWRYINQEPVMDWLYSPVNERHGAKLWMLLSLELWLRAHPGSPR